MCEERLLTLHHSSPLFTLHRSPRQEIGNRREEVAKTGHRGVHQVGCRSRLRPYPGIHEQAAEMGWKEPCGCSFLATTNDEHPLCDPTGSRRYLCLRVPDGEFIDNSSVINYDQLYAVKSGEEL